MVMILQQLIQANSPRQVKFDLSLLKCPIQSHTILTGLEGIEGLEITSACQIEGGRMKEALRRKSRRVLTEDHEIEASFCFLRRTSISTCGGMLTL